MAHLALYRAFRPQTFDEVVAQKHIVYPLRQSVRNGQVNHALLFSGTRGTGKTSLAKIYAKAINCLEPADGNPCNTCRICQGANDGSLIDILEMDAASNNSVENIRKMTEEVIYTPVSAKYKVYIIDEAHMLSSGAFNALLKTLEEPPAHVVFILATTEAHRIPPTIASRCQRYDFRRIGLDDIEAQLRHVAAAETIEIDDDAVKTIASLADGALRDAISLLDQVSGGVAGAITRQHVLDLVGLTSDDHILTLLETILKKQPDRLLTSIDDLAMSGRDLSRLTLDLASHFRNLLILKYTDNAPSLGHLPASVSKTLAALAPDVSADRLIQIIEKLSALLSDLRFSGHPRTTLEIGLLALTAAAPSEQGGQYPTVSQTAGARPGGKAETKRGAIPDPVKPKPAEPETTTASAAPEPKSAASDLQTKTADPETAKPAEAPETAAAEAEAAVQAEDSPAEDRDQVEGKDSDKEKDEDYNAGKQEDRTSPEAAVLPEPEGTASRTSGINHLDLLDLWENVLRDLSANQRMDLRLMAKPADVSLDDRIFTIRVKEGMQGAYQLLSKRDSIELLTQLVVRHLGRPVSIQIAIGSGGGRATVEETWLRELRERT